VSANGILYVIPQSASGAVNLYAIDGMPISNDFNSRTKLQEKFKKTLSDPGLSKFLSKLAAFGRLCRSRCKVIFLLKSFPSKTYSD
jgi:integrase